MSKKKLTMKEVKDRLDFCLQRIIESQKAIEYIHKIVSFYIDYKGDLDKYTKYLEKKNNESGKQDSKESSKGNEGIII